MQRKRKNMTQYFDKTIKEKENNNVDWEKEDYYKERDMNDFCELFHHKKDTKNHK